MKRTNIKSFIAIVLLPVVRLSPAVPEIVLISTQLFVLGAMIVAKGATIERSESPRDLTFR